MKTWFEIKNKEKKMHLYDILSTEQINEGLELLLKEKEDFAAMDIYEEIMKALPCDLRVHDFLFNQITIDYFRYILQVRDGDKLLTDEKKLMLTLKECNYFKHISKRGAFYYAILLGEMKVKAVDED